MAVPTSILYIEQQDGAAHGSYSAWLFSVFNVFLMKLKQDQFCQGWTAEHSAEHTTNLLPDFDYLVILLDIVVGGAVALV